MISVNIKFQLQSILKTHKLSVHEGIAYDCDQCQYQASYNSSLKTHKLITPASVKYKCDQCQYKDFQQGNLKIHKHPSHESVLYSCSECDYQTSLQQRLKKHTQNTQQRNFTQKCPRNKSGVYYNKQDRNGVEGNYTGGCL